MSFKTAILMCITSLTITSNANADFLKTGDNLGDHTAQQALNLNQHFLSGDGDDEGIFVDTDGKVAVGSDNPQATLYVKTTNRVTTDSALKVTNASGHTIHNILDNGNATWLVESTRGNIEGGMKFNTVDGFPTFNLFSMGLSKIAPNLFSMSHHGDHMKWGFHQYKSNTLVIDREGKVGIGTDASISALQVNGYVQFDTTSTLPPAADCDESAERGRMKIDADSGNMYVCVDSGWLTK